MEPLLTLPGEGEHCLEAGGTKVIVTQGEPWDSPQKGQGGVWAGLQSWLLFDLLGGRECRPKALPQSTCTKVVPSEPWAAGIAQGGVQWPGTYLDSAPGCPACSPDHLDSGQQQAI